MRSPARATIHASSTFLKAPVMRSVPEIYSAQLEEKRKDLAALLKWPVDGIQVHESRPTHYRSRAEFRVWHAKEDLFYAMFGTAEKGSRPSPVRVEEFSIGSSTMNALMVPLLKIVKDNQIMRKKLFQCNFHTTLSGQAMITMVYHTKLDETWQEEAEKLRLVLAQEVGMNQDSLSLIGRSKKQKVVLGSDFVIEEFQLDKDKYTYKQFEGCFSQPNATMCMHMLKWSKEVTKDLQGDLLELYCGNGNFTVALASNFEKCLATEISKRSVVAAQENCSANQVSNVEVVRMSSEEFTEAYHSGMNVKGVDMSKYKFTTVLVDPPRAGLDEETEKLVTEFDNIVYISCNPKTLRENLDHILKSHTIENVALFDQFPYTPHIECGVLLRRKLAAGHISPDGLQAET